MAWRRFIQRAKQLLRHALGDSLFSSLASVFSIISVPLSAIGVGLGSGLRTVALSTGERAEVASLAASRARVIATRAVATFLLSMAKVVERVAANAVERSVMTDVNRVSAATSRGGVYRL